MKYDNFRRLWRPWSLLGVFIISAVVLVPSLLQVTAVEQDMGMRDRLRAVMRLKVDQVNQVVARVQVLTPPTPSPSIYFSVGLTVTDVVHNSCM